MIFTTPNPGSWQEFMRKPENKNLSIQEATMKYNTQILIFESQYITFIQQQQQILSQNSSGGGNTPLVSSLSSAKSTPDSYYYGGDGGGGIGEINITLNNEGLPILDDSNIQRAVYYYFNGELEDIELWDVSNVTNMNRMFAIYPSFNQDIGNWDVSSVTKMDYMGYYKSFLFWYFIQH